MEGNVRQALRAFGLDCGGMKREKAAFVCRTERGAVTIERCALPAARILWMHSLKTRLAESGFFVDTFFETADGLPYTEIDGELYTAAAHIDKPEADFGPAKNAARILEQVGRMHGAARGFTESRPPAPPFTPPLTPIETFERDMAALRRYKKQIYKSSPFSDFDVALLRKFDFYVDLLTGWRDLAEAARFPETARLAARGGEVCHNALKEEHVLMDGAVVAVVNFREAACGPQNDDAADVMARHLRESAAPLPFDEAAGVYEAANPYAAGKQDLAARLLYPRRFLKLCETFYQKKRTWIPGTFAARLESAVSADEGRLAYVKDYL